MRLPLAPSAPLEGEKAEASVTAEAEKAPLELPLEAVAAVAPAKAAPVERAPEEAVEAEAVATVSATEPAA